MKRLVLVVATALALTGCGNPEAARQQRGSMFVGIDVSGSFYNTKYYEDSLDFLSYYLYAHLNQAGNLKGVKNLFVGSIGGEVMDETKAFHPIQDFEGKSVDQIRANLKSWFKKSNKITDFNVFFKQVAIIAQKRNLSLTPITVVLLSDGIPDFPGKSEDSFESIDVTPLEYLSRNITLRLLYANPVVANNWETRIERKRLRVWTADNQVMQGWKGQLKTDTSVDHQDKFWAWVSDIVDFRVQPVRFKAAKKK